MKQKFQEDFVEPHKVVEYSEKATLLVGCVYQLSDKKHWGFTPETPESWHPGVCYDLDQGRLEAHLLKGTSRAPGSRYGYAFAAVHPDESNGLEKTTYFSLRQTFPFPSRKIELLHHNRRLGKLSEQDLKAIHYGLSEFSRDEKQK